MLEIGKTYSFKTLTFYYIGTVVAQFPTHAVINNGKEVFETGPNDKYYAGQIRLFEVLPDGCFVPLIGQVFIAPYPSVIQEL